MLLLQIFLSFKNFQRHDFVETHGEDQLYNVDMPMIILCAETPFEPMLPELFYLGLDPDADEEERSFIGWTVENVSTHDHIKSKAKVQNISDLLKVTWVANRSWSNTDGSIQLTEYFEPLRINYYEGQCFSLAVPKQEVRTHIVDSNRFIMSLGLKEDVRVSLYDPNTYNGYFNPDAVEFPVDNKGLYQMFDVALEQIIQSPDDPKVGCESYAATSGYYNCAKQKFEEIFMNMIKCVPPWFTDDQSKVCQYDNEVVKSVAIRKGYEDQMLGKDIFQKNPKKGKLLREDIDRK